MQPWKWSPGHSLYTVISPFGLQFSKEEEELCSQMSSFNEAMTQIRELEERAMEELREIIQVHTGPTREGWPAACTQPTELSRSWDTI